MDKAVKIWIVAFALFWLSLAFTLIADVVGLFETSNIGFTETIWISWIVWSIGLGIALTIGIYFTKKK